MTTTANQRTNLNCFVRTMVDHIYDSLREAQSNPGSRNAAVIEARDGYWILTRKLAREDTPQESKGHGLSIVLQLDNFFAASQISGRCDQQGIREGSSSNSRCPRSDQRNPARVLSRNLASAARISASISATSCAVKCGSRAATRDGTASMPARTPRRTSDHSRSTASASTSAPRWRANFCSASSACARANRARSRLTFKRRSAWASRCRHGSNL